MTQTTTPALIIEQQLGLATWQDLGREKAQHLGFSATGVADVHAFAYANMQLNKSPNSPMIELTLAEIVLSITVDSHFCITGAECNIYLDDKKVEPWKITPIKAGKTMHISRPSRGVHVYLAFTHDIKLPMFLNSVSPVPEAMATVLNMSPLFAGQQFPLLTSKPPPTIDKLSYQPNPTTFYRSEILTLRFITTDLWHALSTATQSTFTTQTFTIAPDSNKMGYRLKGEPLALAQHYFQQLSHPCAFGAIQLTSNGQAIVLMKDRQTIGGYPVIGHVMQTDLYRLAQKNTADKVQFIPTTLDFAQTQLVALQKRLNVTMPIKR